MGHAGRESYKQASDAVTIVTALKGKPRLRSMLYSILPIRYFLLATSNQKPEVKGTC